MNLPTSDPPTGIQLQAVLCRIYRTPEALAQMVRARLNSNLEEITAPGTLNDRVFALIQWAAANGKTADLLAVATEESPRCPYPGMIPFSAAEAGLFFGRETEIRNALQYLRGEQVLLVIGPSGSGKSSLVFAGLLPRLQSSSYWPPNSWCVRVLRPGDHPVAALDSALGAAQDTPGDTISALLAAQPGGAATHLLLVVDQLEELFSLAPRADQPGFIARLQALVADPRCTLLLTMRADFYPDLMNSPLWPIPPSRRLEVPTLRGPALREAIEGPARAVGVELEGGLVERLLADTADEPGALPLLQETLVLLWEGMDGRLLRLTDYLELGQDGQSGLAVALSRKANATLDALPPDEQPIARRIFLRLVQFGEGRPDTRRQQTVEELQSQTDDPARFAHTLRYLADNRLLTLGGAEAGRAQTVDIAHEALIAGWPLLSDWLVKRRTAEISRRRIEAKADEWTRLGRGSGGLLDVIELGEAESWIGGPDAAELGYDAAVPALIAASRAAIAQAEAEKEAAQRRELEAAQRAAAAERRSRLRLQWLVVAMLVLVAGTGTLAGIFLYRTVVLRWRAQGELAAIPAGTVVMGTDDPDTNDNRHPVITITLPGFSIERYEVANWQYALCVEAGACDPPQEFESLREYDYPQLHDYPVTGISGLQAAAYCRWLGRRLPSEVEWERAAHGPADQPRTWPWGDATPDPQHANIPIRDGFSPTSTVPVTANPEGATPAPERVFNLTGNAFEWTASFYGGRYDRDLLNNPWDGTLGALAGDRARRAGQNLVTRGGSWAQPALIFDRNPTAAITASEDLGFRCATGP